MSDYRLSTKNGVIRAIDNKFIPADDNNEDWKEFREWLIKGGVPLPPVEERPKGDWDTFRDGIMIDPGYNRIRIQMLNSPAQLYGSRLEAAASRPTDDINLITIRNIWNQMMEIARSTSIGPTIEEIHLWNQLGKSTNMPLQFDSTGNIVLL